MSSLWASLGLLLCAGLLVELARHVSRADGHADTLVAVLCAATVVGAVICAARLSAPFSPLDAPTERSWSVHVRSLLRYSYSYQQSPSSYTPLTT
jgi:hypothetical protein